MAQKSLHPLITIVLLSFVAFSVAADETVNASKETTPKPGPEVRIVSVEKTTTEGMAFIAFSCELANPHDKSLQFVGYRPDSFDPPIAEGTVSPIYEIELRQNDAWQKHPIGWCGWGMDAITVAGKATAKFSFAIPADVKFDAVRVGVRWAENFDFETADEDDLSIAWSEPHLQ